MKVYPFKDGVVGWLLWHWYEFTRPRPAYHDLDHNHHPKPKIFRRKAS